MQNIGVKKMTPNRYSILLRGVSRLTSFIAIAVLLTACGGGSGDNGLPPTSDASLAGIISISPDIPLVTTLCDTYEGPICLRIVDPGDDIGNTPVPVPDNLSDNGDYVFNDLDPDPLSYISLRFTVDADLENHEAQRTPIGFNIPISLAQGFDGLLSATITQPSDNILQMGYVYLGPDGSREVRLKLDFVADLLTFDLDADGLYDDLIAVDANHDAIPDEQAYFFESFDPGTAGDVIGMTGGVGSSALIISGVVYEIWGSTNIVNSYNNEALSLSEVSSGANITMQYIPYGGNNVAVKISLQPSPDIIDIGFTIQRDGPIEEINDTSIFIGGVLFHDYFNANIEDVLGNTVQPADLEIGTYINVTGTRDGDVIKATDIIVREVSPPAAFIERQGTITSLVPEENPESMTVGGINFTLTGGTVINDLAGMVVNTEYLIVGNPIWVLGHQSGTSYTADLIELQYEIPDEPVIPEIIVLIDDPDALPDVQNAVDQVGSDVEITPVVVASYPASVSSADCIEDVFDELFWKAYLLMGLPGYIEALPRVDNDECVTLILIWDGYPDTQEWVRFFFPIGIGGAPLEFDLVAMPPFYGTEPEMNKAYDIAEDLSDLLWSNGNVVMIYISSDIGFSRD